MQEAQETPIPVQVASPQTAPSNLSNGKKAGLLAVIVVAALLLIAGAVWVMWQANNNQAAGVETAAKINITNKAFAPATLKIKKDQSVTWTNSDVESHHVIADDTASPSTPGFDSQEPLKQNDTYTYTFNSAGTFNYHDQDNPINFKGTIIVE